ncbi:MAG: phosphodiester glycosidase family protein [Oscillospiraceae bacterium]|nr:phosphodiester glycosidase family protein [Oscillospiraceae bacterium]
MADNFDSFSLDDILSEFSEPAGAAPQETIPFSALGKEKKSPPKSAAVPNPAPAPQPQKTKKNAAEDMDREERPVKKTPAAKKAKTREPQPKTAALGLVFALLSIVAILWVAVSVHQDQALFTAESSSPTATRNLMDKYDVAMNNIRSEALSDITYIRKQYTIAQDVVVAPKAAETGFGSTTDPEKVKEIIAQAEELLDGQELVWTGEETLFPGSEIQYYYDETILVICWKEIIDNGVCSFAEVKVADPSQLRRYLAGGSYGSGEQHYASDMAKAVNAVVAINGDFYTFRNPGINVYQGVVKKCNGDKIETACFTNTGSMKFLYAGDVTNAADMERYVEENNIQFTLSFGPVLVDNGELRKTSTYVAGEVDQPYARAAMGMTDDLHYLLLTVNAEGNYQHVVNINTLGQYMYNKNCRDAYTLDGGQTAVLIMNGSAVNRVVYGYERLMSDIVYFATAIPEEEGGA